MTVSIREINLSYKKDLKEFIELPWSLYLNDPCWVPPLKMAVKDLLNQNKHPFYKTATVKSWLAEKDGVVVGRIMAVNNHAYNKYQNTKIGFFGFYEAINDQEVSSLLLKTAEASLASEGLTSMQGPMNPGTNYECGFLVDKFDDAPQIMMTYNPPYYPTQIENFGYTKAMDLLAYNVDAHFTMPKIIMDIAERTEKKSKVTFRTLNLKKWTQELDTMFDIYNSAWEANWGFVPMTKEEFYHTAKDLKSIVDPELVHFALVDGVVAGFILTLPDLNQVFKEIPSGNLSPMAIYKILTAKKRMNRVRVITMGVKKEFRKIGLETLLYKHNHIAIKKNPLNKNIEMSWILENNLEMNKPLIRMAGVAYKRYRLYEKAI
ncbi:MAG: GNAT family N-acetyltransferase [Bacteriovorax sp.]|nr:GNAT family N-acetyltransferase [Bacteriovorax sp.]